MVRQHLHHRRRCWAFRAARDQRSQPVGATGGVWHPWQQYVILGQHRVSEVVGVDHDVIRGGHGRDAIGSRLDGEDRIMVGEDIVGRRAEASLSEDIDSVRE